MIPAGILRSDVDELKRLERPDHRRIREGKMYWELVKKPAYKEYKVEMSPSIDTYSE